MSEKAICRIINVLSLKWKRAKHSLSCLSKIAMLAKFELGRTVQLTKEQKRIREREQKRIENRKKRVRTEFVPRPLWRIVPCDKKYSFCIDTLSGNTFFQKMKSLEEFGSTYTKKCPLFPDYKPNPALMESIQELKAGCKSVMAENQILRWKLKRFLTLWRVCHCKKINDTDFITLCPIEKPITIVSFSTRSIYTFESSSILQDIHKKLLHHSGLFPHPIFPRNPYTNENFTLSQLLNIHKQCSRFGNVSWSLEAFYRSKMSIPTFLQVQRKGLRIHALKSILFDYSDIEGTILLLNFIESQHEEHEAAFNKHLYRWCIMNIPEDHKIQAWRSFCKEYYENEIIAEDDDERDNCFVRISRKTGFLCAPPNDLLAKRNMAVHSK